MLAKLIEILDEMDEPAIAVSNVLDDMGNRSFSVSVQGLPLEKHYIAMHSDLNLFEKLLKQLKAYEPKTGNLDLVNAAFNKAKSAQIANSKLAVAPLQKADKETAYNSYYEMCGNIIEHFEKNIDYLTKEKTMSKKDFMVEVVQNYNSLVEIYNNFNE
jgi:hypothetical protein